MAQFVSVTCRLTQSRLNNLLNIVNAWSLNTVHYNTGPLLGHLVTDWLPGQTGVVHQFVPGGPQFMGPYVSLRCILTHSRFVHLTNLVNSWSLNAVYYDVGVLFNRFVVDWLPGQQAVFHPVGGVVAGAAAANVAADVQADEIDVDIGAELQEIDDALQENADAVQVNAEANAIGGGQQDADGIGGDQQDADAIGGDQQDADGIGGDQQNADAIAGGQQEADGIGGDQQDADAIGGGQQDADAIGGGQQDADAIGGGQQDAMAQEENADQQGKKRRRLA